MLQVREFDLQITADTTVDDAQKEIDSLCCQIREKHADAARCCDKELLELANAATNMDEATKIKQLRRTEHKS